MTIPPHVSPCASMVQFCWGLRLNPNPFLGLLLQGTGGLSAASCYLPFRGIRRWSWEIYWLTQGVFSWIVVPPIFAALLVPGFAAIVHGASANTLFYTWFW